MKKVLIALDYDPTAQKIAELGFTFAKLMNAEITLLHVVSDATHYSFLEYSPIMGFNGFTDANIEFETIDMLEKAAYDFLNKAKQHLGDEAIKIEVRNGDFANSIISAAKDLHADVIVLGTHSRRGLDKILMGSVAEKVLHQSTIPLFIIPTKDVSKK